MFLEFIKTSNSIANLCKGTKKSFASAKSCRITYNHSDSKVKFTLYPMVHLASLSFYRDISEDLKRFDFILYEGVTWKKTETHFDSRERIYTAVVFGAKHMASISHCLRDLGFKPKTKKWFDLIRSSNNEIYNEENELSLTSPSA